MVKYIAFGSASPLVDPIGVNILQVVYFSIIRHNKSLNESYI